MANVVDKEIAIKDVNAWLDYKRVKDSMRDKRKDAIDVMVDAVMCGDVSISQAEYLYGKEKLTGPVIKQRLAFPVGSLTELTYKPRETTGNLSASVRSNEGKMVSSCYASILGGGVMPEELEKLDSEDSRVLQAVVSFFL